MQNLVIKETIFCVLGLTVEGFNKKGGCVCGGGGGVALEVTVPASFYGSIMLVAVPLPLNISIPRVSCQEERSLADDGSAIAAM